MSVAAERAAGVIRIAVRDTGIGIPLAEQQRLFERFFRSSAATERQIPGTGLGLAISRAIVVGHGGAMDFTSKEGGGTEFVIELPAGAPAPPTSESIRAA